ncbi:MAG: putative oxidoreductase [Actinomycetia bacterium]|nr:putative oxidoreductase [Actinomycetes bacterium]
MDQNPIGKTPATVTALGFGGASAGNLYQETTDADTVTAVDQAWAGGIRYFDTAPHYGLGLSERRLGAVLRDRPRELFVISTKVGRLLEPNPWPAGSDLAAGGFAVPDTLRRRFDFSAGGVRRSLEASLERLGLDRMDLVYVHDPDDHVDEAVAGAIPELIRMREEGLVTAVGVGMNQWQAPLRMVRETGIDLVMLAGRWTLLDRSGQPLLDECAARGVAVVAAAPFNSGLLARAWPPDGAYFDYGPAAPEVLARARALAGVCERYGVSLPDAAVQFPLRHPAVVSVVSGMRSGEQVASTLARFATVVPDEAWTELDAC